MAFDFPASPVEDQVFSPPGGPVYVYKAPAWRSSMQATQYGEQARRNRIVNGAMQISQENGDTSSNASGYYAADQWLMFTNIPTSGIVRHPAATMISPNGGRVIQTSVITAKPSLAASDIWMVRQIIEGVRIADFQWGTANAKQVILRFWSYGTAGTYGVSLQNGAANRVFIASFTITTTNVWQAVTIVISGDTTGTWLRDTGVGIHLNFVLASGSNYTGIAGWQAGGASNLSTNSNGAAVANNNLYIADVGLYLDAQNTGVAPRWETPDEAQEMIACQRYYEILDGGGFGFSGNTTVGITYIAFAQWRTQKRIQPAVSGAHVIVASFPGVVGGLTASGVGGVREARAASVTATTGHFLTTVTGNARM